MLHHVIRPLLAIFETIATGLTAYGALDAEPLLKALQRGGMTFDPGFPGLVRK